MPLLFAPIKNMGCSLSGPLSSNVKGKIERKFSKSKNFPNYDLLGAWRSGGMNVAIFVLQKVHPCVNPRCLTLSHFACTTIQPVNIAVKP